MPKNNEWAIPKNIDKPVETVYELKGNEYKVPSFEEFMKNYENDGSLNYDDLSVGDIGVAKASGPCYYTNKDCTCYAYQSPPWVQLYLACPATGCPNRQCYSWVHSSCEKPIYISTNLDLKCVNCNNPSSMLQWRFNCYSSNHPGRDYAGTTHDDFFTALSFVNNIRQRTQRVQDVLRIISNKAWDL